MQHCGQDLLQMAKSCVRLFALARNGGLRMDQAKRFKEIEKENARLKKLLAEAELDKAILKEAASGNF